MRTFVASAVAGFLILGWASIGAADQPESRAIIDRAIQAAGGEEALAKNKASTWNETGMFYGLGDGVAYKGSYASELPDQFKMVIENFVTIVLDGDKGWENGTELPAARLAEMKESNYAGWVSNLLPLKDPAFKLTTIGETKVGDQPAVGVKVSREGHSDVKLYFNKDNGLLVKEMVRLKSEGKDVEQETELRNYKEMNGIKMPTKFVIQRDGKKYVEAEVVDWKGAVKLDKSLFKP